MGYPDHRYGVGDSSGVGAMTQTDILQLIGSAAITVFGLLLYRISTRPADWFCKYGREALLCAAAYLLTVAAVRVGTALDVMSQTDARTINGLVALGFVSIVAQIAFTHRRVHSGEA